MATETQTASPTETGQQTWIAGVVGGLAGGLVFGAMMSMMMPDIIEGAIPGMYGLSGGLAGWFLHMSHAAILGVVFAAIADVRPALSSSTGSGVTSGIVYGIVLWIILAVIVMPIWVGAMTPAEPPLPNINVQSLLGHLVYGTILGGIYAVYTE